MIGLGTLGIIVIQAAAALSVIGFFLRRSGRHWWRTFLAPGLGFLGLAVSAVLLVNNFSLLTGSTNPVVAGLPWLLLIAAAGGVGYASWLKIRRPARYAALAAGAERDADHEPGTAPVRLVPPKPDDIAA
jgi:hypothetical protein